MKKWIVANFKMNKTVDEMTTYVNNLKGKVLDYVVLCVPYTGFHALKHENVTLGSQNVSHLQNKALTGEISSEMLKSENVKFCIVGHSERRIMLKESNSHINKKIVLLSQNEIIPILCIGEREQKDEKFVLSYLKRQLKECLKNIDKQKQIFVAYEPVYAIGSKQSISCEKANKIALFIKNYLNSQGFLNISVLYGGSVNNENAREFFKKEHIDGVLVGGYSLNSNNLLNLVKEREWKE